MVRSVMTVAHFFGPSTARQRQNLVSKANTEKGQTGGHHLLRKIDGVVTRLGISGSIGKKNTVWIVGHDVFIGALGRHDGHAATEINQNSKNVAFDTKIQCHHMMGWFRSRWRFHAQLPRRLCPLKAFTGRHNLGQIHSFQSREGLRLRDGHRFVCRITGQDTTGLGTLFTNNTSQLACIDIRDADRVIGHQIIRQTLFGAEIGGNDW